MSLTLFTTCKPFEGKAGLIQRNAIGSWTQLENEPDIILFGQEKGVPEIAEKLGVTNMPVERKYGFPLFRDMVDKARGAFDNDMLCYTNADMIYLDDLVQVAGVVENRSDDPSLTIGRRWDVEINHPIDFSGGEWQVRIREYAARHGRPHAEFGIDYFMFRGDVWGDIPDFIVGVIAYDNWLVWKALMREVPIFNATNVITAIHQEHGGTGTSRMGKRANHNRELAIRDGMNVLCGINHATHKFEAM